MNQTTLKIAAAALMHDIGKFADNSTMGVTEKYLNDNAGQYLPFHDGRHTHRHAVFTAAFIEQYADSLPAVFNSGDWGEGDSFINLAAGHHNPETPMQWIVAMADRVSSGWDRDEFDSQYGKKSNWKGYRKTRLLPLFEQLRISKPVEYESIDSFQYCYPLEPMNPQSIFPGLREKTVPKGAQEAIEAYQKIFDAFSAGLRKLARRDEITLWLEAFESLMMVYTSPIPAARAGNVIPDVSLYDHSKATSSLAAAIYLYHRENGNLETEAVRDYSDKKFLIVNGDFQGIQNFIFSRFSESARYRSKILRGRSFAVSLITELASDMLCRSLGLPVTSVILNAAGRFTLISPNTSNARESIEKVQREINNWLFKISFGETVINFSSVEATCNDFVQNRFSALWDRINQTTALKKFESDILPLYGGAVDGYLDSFINEPDHPPLCPICGKRPSVKAAQGTQYVKDLPSVCNLCRDHIFLGTNLVKKTRILVVAQDDATGHHEKNLFEPIFGKYGVLFNDHGQGEETEYWQVLRTWDLGSNRSNLESLEVAVRFFNGFVPKYSEDDDRDECILEGRKREEKKLEDVDNIQEGEPKTLNHIACMALNPSNGEGFKGVPALGVLKADVDRLGLLMSCGLKEGRLTLSRLATLSRQLDFFFTIYLPQLLESQAPFKNIYTVFAGGDDLFLIGPWNRIMDLSLVINKKFRSYVCNNPEVSLSAGVSLHKPHTPIDNMARSSEAALEQSKNGGRDRFTVFGETITWNTAKELSKIRETLEIWLENGWITRGVFYGLNEFIGMAAREQRIRGMEEIPIRHMDCTKWRSLLVYSIERNVARRIKGKEREEAVFQVIQNLTKWLEKYGGNFRYPVWSLMYDRR